jgi:hypothetical protein
MLSTASLLLISGCGSAASSSTTAAASLSTCAQWNSADRASQQAYVAHALGQHVEAHGHYEFASAQQFLDGWLSKGCHAAAHVGDAATTLLSSLGSPAAAEAASHGEVAPTTATTTPPATTVATATPPTTPAFSLHGHTEHGDAIRLIGRWGPILDRGETDLEPAALRQCPDTDGRELVRKLELTVSITSGLSGDVRLGGFAVQVTEENQHDHLLLDYVLAGPEGTNCYRDTTESGGFVDLGTLQPHVPSHVNVWVVLLDAITPRDPHPSAAKLAHEEWGIGYPAVSVNGASAITGGGELLVTG